MKRSSTGNRSRSAVLPARRAGLRLRATDVDVWRVALDAQPDAAVAELHRLLSPDEAARAAKFYFDRDRRRFVVGRGVLRVLLARYLDCPPDDIAFTYGSSGKPALAGLPDEPLHFNLAHSEGLAVYAFTRVGEVGVDLERVRDLPDWEYIASTCFSPADRARVNGADGDERRVEFFRAWTRQEALLKATGDGMDALDVPAVAPAGEEFAIYPLCPGQDYVGALAIGRAARWASTHQWRSSPWPGKAQAPRGGRRIALSRLSSNGIQFL